MRFAHRLYLCAKCSRPCSRAGYPDDGWYWTDMAHPAAQAKVAELRALNQAAEIIEVPECVPCRTLPTPLGDEVRE